MVAASSSGPSPWLWVPDTSAWFQLLIDPLVEWMPALELGLDVRRVKLALADAIDQQCGWLHHPSVNPLTIHHRHDALQRDFQFVTWLAAHVDGVLGEVELPFEMAMWTPGGDVLVPAGRHSLQSLGQLVSTSAPPVPLALDVWCRTTGFVIQDSWASLGGDASPEQIVELQHEVVEYCRAIALMERKLPHVLQWMLAGTQIVVPQMRQPDGVIHSGSQANLPGLVYTDLHGGRIQILETTVHETAHNHLYMAEAQHPLVDPEHQGRYHSPLRPEPRPLRGILLACHALAYICAAFVDARQCGYVSREHSEATLRDLTARMDEAERTLVDNRHHLTPWGRAFLEQTQHVCAYVRVPA